MRFIPVVAALVLLSCEAQAETLIAPPYPAATPWKLITDKHDDKMIWREWIPADQTEADIRDILTAQTFYIQKGRDPADFLRDLFARLRGACSGISVNGPNARTEDGHVVSYGQVYCVGANGKDVDIFAKAIGGHDALYVVQREFQRPAEAGAIPGMRRFSKDQKDEAMTALAAQKAANDYLVSQVKLGSEESSTPPSRPVQSLSAASAPPKHDDGDVSASFGFEAGKTTQDQIEEKLGRPTMQTHHADGQHVDLYSFRNGTLMAGFLFWEGTMSSSEQLHLPTNSHRYRRVAHVTGGR